MTIQDSVPEALVLDQVRLSQVLTNLLTNAVRFTHEGSVHIEALRVGSELNIFVHDTGIGIPDESKEFVFEEFTKIDNYYNSERGVGIGLAICTKIIGHMGGEISLESNAGSGSTFKVTLPVIDGDQCVSICDSG